jgi:arylsulfatase A-like enzyme
LLSRARGLIAGMLVGLLFACACADALAQRWHERNLKKKPNVLFIVTDDQRAEETMDVMPATRRWFGAGGTRFQNAFTTTPMCCPARASILSGRYAHNHGVLLNLGSGDLDQRYALQSYLQRAGYRTGIVGKFLNNVPWDVTPPYFDRWVINLGARYVTFWSNDQGNLGLREQYLTDYVADKAVEFIRGQEVDDKRPWFLYVAPIAPHDPATPADRHANAPVPQFTPFPSYFEEDRTDKPPHVQAFVAQPGDVQTERETQLRSLMAVDELVDRVLNEMRNTSEERRTLAFFLSDNGYLWGDHGLRWKAHPYAIRVPLFMRWPARVGPGAVDTRLVTNIDIAPTVLEAARLKPELPMDGFSLLDRRRSRSRVLTEYWAAQGSFQPPGTWASILTPSYHYIEHYGTGPVTLPPTSREYYDMRTDPWRLTNLLGDASTSNDPPLGPLSSQLAQDRNCAGRVQLEPDRPACP